MFLTTIYLLVGTIGNIHVKQSPEKKSVSISIQQEYAANRSYTSYTYYQTLSKQSKTQKNSNIAVGDIGALKIYERFTWQFTIFDFDNTADSYYFLFFSRAPPCHFC